MPLLTPAVPRDESENNLSMIKPSVALSVRGSRSRPAWLCPQLCPRAPNATQLYPTPANLNFAEALISRPRRGDFKSVASASSAIPPSWVDVVARGPGARALADGNEVTLQQVFRGLWYTRPLLEWAKHDPGWEMEAIKKSARDAAAAVQRFAAGEPVPDLRRHLSAAFFERLSRQPPERRRLDVDLRRIQIVEAIDFVDDERDRVWVYLPGVIVKTGPMDFETRHDADQLWKFGRMSTRWVLDEIDDTPTSAKFEQFTVARGEDLPEPAQLGPTTMSPDPSRH